MLGFLGLFGSMSSTALSFVLSSFLNIHTYVGIFLGAVFSPFWVKVWGALKGWILSKFPKAAPVVNEVTDVANQVVTDITPVTNEVTNVIDSNTTNSTSTTK